MKREFMKLIASKKSLILIGVMLVFMILDVVFIWYERVANGVTPVDMPYFAAVTFLSSGGEGHMFQILLLWFLPLYMLILYGDKVIQEFKTGVSNILISKLGLKNYLIQKMGSGFLIAFSVFFCCLLINFVITYLLFLKGQYIRVPLESVDSIGDLGWQYQNGIAANLIFMIIASCFAGLTMVLSVVLSFMVPDKKLVYVGSFFVWFLAVLNNPSVMLAFQPFAEFGFDMIGSIFITNASYLLVIIAILSFVVIRRKDYV